MEVPMTDVDFGDDGGTAAPFIGVHRERRAACRACRHAPALGRGGRRRCVLVID